MFLFLNNFYIAFFFCNVEIYFEVKFINHFSLLRLNFESLESLSLYSD